MKLVILPLKKELKLLVAALDRLRHPSESQRLGRLSFYRVPSLNITCVTGGLGKAQFALQTQYSLNLLNSVNHILALGSAGALDPSLKVGDVVIASSIVEHDFAHQEDGQQMPMNHKTFIPDYSKIKRGFTVLEAPIASGDENIICEQRAKDLRSKTKAAAVAWEGAGGARCAAFNNLPYTEIRGISDTANSATLTDFTSHLPHAIEHLTEILADICNPNT